MIDLNVVLDQTELRIRRYLIDAIHRGSKGVSYTAVNEDLSLGLDFRNNRSDGGQIGIWLGHISTYEYEHDRPFLSAIVMNQNSILTHGEGFYNLLEELTGIDRNIYMNDIRRIKRLVDEVTTFWTNPANYTAYRDI